MVNTSLKNISLIQGLNTQNLVIAGLDIGKKKHKSAFHVYEIRDGKAIQVHRKSMTHWPYYTGKPWNPLKPSQVEYCKEAIKNFGIACLYYDNTRGELEGANDSGLLSTHFIPIVFTPKMKVQMATDVEKIVGNKQVELIDDEEMLTSICSVTNDLQKLDIAGDHSDDFDSFCLAMIGFSKYGVTGIDNKVRVGSRSIFDQKGLPKGF